MSKRVKKLVGHSEQVNSSCASSQQSDLICSVSDDQSLKLWDPREKAAVMTLATNYPLTACVFSQDGSRVYMGGLDN